ncbi:hypothetical protein A2U01_0062037, partial [Trifolium medium]|nr:hypothetical protein [Trifolium medium]
MDLSQQVFDEVMVEREGYAFNVNDRGKKIVVHGQKTVPPYVFKKKEASEV